MANVGGFEYIPPKWYICNIIWYIMNKYSCIECITKCISIISCIMYLKNNHHIVPFHLEIPKTANNQRTMTIHHLFLASQLLSISSSKLISSSPRIRSNNCKCFTIVGGWTHLKNISQIGSFPQIGMNINIYIYMSNHHPVQNTFWKWTKVPIKRTILRGIFIFQASMFRNIRWFSGRVHETAT